MSDFIDTKAKALTMLYLKKLDTSSLTPEEFVDKYDEIYNAISTYNKQKHPTGVKTFK